MSSHPPRSPTPASESERSRTSTSDEYENLSGIPLTPFEHTFPPRPQGSEHHHGDGYRNIESGHGRSGSGVTDPFDAKELIMIIGSTIGVVAVSTAALCITLLNIML